MRITKKWLKDVKIRLQSRIDEVTKLNHNQLKQAVLNWCPDLVIHPDGTCPNCGAIFDCGIYYECKCSPEERQKAASTVSPQACIRLLLKSYVEEFIPSPMVD